MTGIKEQYSSHFIWDEFGVVTGSVSAVQFPTGTCGMVRFKADSDNDGTFNLGRFNIGEVNFPLRAGDDTGWIATTNLNRYRHQNNSGTSDYLYWWLQK